MTELARGLEESVSNQWASREFQHFNDDDPREVAGRAERAYRQSLEGRLEAVANPTRLEITLMERGVAYEL